MTSWFICVPQDWNLLAEYQGKRLKDDGKVTETPHL